MLCDFMDVLAFELKKAPNTHFSDFNSKLTKIS
jgi:hypothetical protein